MTNPEVFPVVIVSKCLEFEACRYDGVMITDSFVAALKPYVRFFPVCPEVEIGLGVPRPPIRIILSGKDRLLYQYITGEEFSREITGFVNRFLDSLSGIDGFILKCKSPSCGLRDARIYPDMEAKAPIERGAGFFGSRVHSRFAHLAVEDERRLKNFRIRDHFLIKLFTLARFRKLRENSTMHKLIDFHSRNKLLFMAYNQSKNRKLGAIIANHEHLDIENAVNLYHQTLLEVLQSSPRPGALINMMEHAFGGVSRNLTSDERKFFKKCIEDYREKKIPLCTPVNLLHSWAMRFDLEYLKGQTFLEPYPLDLLDVSGSGKGMYL